MSITCPNCNSAAEPFTLEADLTFDKCTSCKGMWLDKGELGRTAGVDGDFPDPETLKLGLPSNKSCPKCAGIQLHEVSYKPGGSVFVDVCRSCEGLWLDSRELAQIQDILRKHRIEEKKKRVQGLNK